MTRRLLGLALALAAADGSRATNLDAPADLKPINVEITTASYRGQPATRVRGRVAAGSAAGTEFLALLPGTSFLNGSIEVDVAGLLDEGARADARGFIGLAFDVTPGTGSSPSTFAPRTAGPWTRSAATTRPNAYLSDSGQALRARPGCHRHGPGRNRRASSSVAREPSVIAAIVPQLSPWPRITTMEVEAATAP
ncbi:MAG TPA: hypothetical protein PLD86_15715 [Vicinamibacteria bacterium]|nr:hypothetical protein [Vicinamibacteria bacterium]